MIKDLVLPPKCAAMTPCNNDYVWYTAAVTLVQVSNADESTVVSQAGRCHTRSRPGVSISEFGILAWRRFQKGGPVLEGWIALTESKLGTRCCPGVKPEAGRLTDSSIQWSAVLPRKSPAHRRPAQCMDGSNVARGSDATAGSRFDRPAGARNNRWSSAPASDLEADR